MLYICRYLEYNRRRSNSPYEFFNNKLPSVILFLKRQQPQGWRRSNRGHFTVNLLPLYAAYKHLRKWQIISPQKTREKQRTAKMLSWQGLMGRSGVGNARSDIADNHCSGIWAWVRNGSRCLRVVNVLTFIRDHLGAQCSTFPGKLSFTFYNACRHMFSTCCQHDEPKIFHMTKLNHPCNFPIQQEIFRGREGN